MKKHISTLSVLHYVYGALVCAGGVVALVFLGVGTLLSSELVMDGAQDAPVEWLGPFFQYLGITLFILLEVWGLLIMLSGHWISQSRNRTGSMIIAVLCLLSVPFGTALGVFTLVVLSDDAVMADYGLVK